MTLVNISTNGKYAIVLSLVLPALFGFFLPDGFFSSRHIDAQARDTFSASDERKSIESAAFAYLGAIESQDYEKIKELTTRAPESYWQADVVGRTSNANGAIPTSSVCCSDSLYEDVSKLTPSLMRWIQMPVRSVLDVEVKGDIARVRVRLRFKNDNHETLPYDILLVKYAYRWKVFDFKSCSERPCLALYEDFTKSKKVQ